MTYLDSLWKGFPIVMQRSLNSVYKHRRTLK
nr:MAG TPA: hypothetical protein [Caudoviricetes sp.]